MSLSQTTDVKHSVLIPDRMDGGAAGYVQMFDVVSVVGQ